jgi:hypothetical protein
MIAVGLTMIDAIIVLELWQRIMSFLCFGKTKETLGVVLLQLIIVID